MGYYITEKKNDSSEEIEYYITANGTRMIYTDYMKSIGWRFNGVGRSQEFIPLELSGEEQRTLELLERFGLGDTYDMWKETSERWKIKLPVLVCIAKAETTLGKNMTTTNNIANVGNTNSGRRTEFDSLQIGIDKIGSTLNNRYLGKYTMLVELNETRRINAGLPSCHNSGVFCYSMVSTREGHKTSARHVNTKNCLSTIYDKDINGWFKFRIE